MAARDLCLDTCKVLGYLLTMLKWNNQAVGAYSAQTKTQRKRRFILRDMVSNIILWLGITVVVGFTDHPRPNSVRSVATLAIVMLPIILLGGYLSAKWKWSDFEKKHSE